MVFVRFCILVVVIRSDFELLISVIACYTRSINCKFDNWNGFYCPWPLGCINIISLLLILTEIQSLKRSPIGLTYHHLLSCTYMCHNCIKILSLKVKCSHLYSLCISQIQKFLYTQINIFLRPNSTADKKSETPHH